ncbi:DUF4225 domain-containing protein [Enterobacteriaceae bacterium 4M9]|nr:DUF4225 domain-containing protein [Enterobacteriaceae bacterium 4M9]
MSTVAILTIRFYEESAQLKRVALLASGFFIENSAIRMEYLKDIDDFVNMIYSKISSSLYSFHDKSLSLQELSNERESTEKEYQKLRQGDYTKYLTTDIFEEHGVLKYMPVAADIFSGAFQAYAGYRLAHFGPKAHIKHLKTVGLTLIAHGSNNIYEAVSPLLYEGRHQSGWLRDIYRGISSKMGYSDNQGDLG